MDIIPRNNNDIPRIIPESIEERKYTFQFRSLTDIFEPVNQYDRKIIKIVTGDNVLDEHIERLSRKIEARGEYVLLIKRRLDGPYCSCYDPITKVVRRKYCLQCYGTRIVGGYDLFWNTLRDDGKVVVAAPFSDESIDWKDYGRDVKAEYTMWTLPWVPLTNGSTTFSYDFIIRYNEDGSELGRYYVKNVKPSRSIGNKITYQQFTISLATRPTYDNEGNIVRRGDIIYEIDVNKLDKIEGTE